MASYPFLERSRLGFQLLKRDLQHDKSTETQCVRLRKLGVFPVLFSRMRKEEERFEKHRSCTAWRYDKCFGGNPSEKVRCPPTRDDTVLAPGISIVAAFDPTHRKLIEQSQIYAEVDES